jgi:Tfp pilus assembly protein PilV
VRRPRAGFSIVEVIAAILVLAIGVLSLAGLGISASRMTRAGGRQTVAAAVAQSRFDSLASLPCETLAVSGPVRGTAITRGIQERWVVQDGRNVKQLTDTLFIPERTRPAVYRSVIPCRES